MNQLIVDQSIKQFKIPVMVNSFPMKSTMVHYEVVLNEHEMNQTLMQEIDKHATQQILFDPGSRQNDTRIIGADMTNWNMREHPGFKKLMAITDTVVKDLQYRVFDLKIPVYLKEIWGTKYKSNDETIEHNHYPSSWSFVYYPNEVEGAPGLTFGEAGVERTIKKGMLLFFHSMLKHSVRKQEFKGFRYCVAGNYETKDIMNWVDKNFRNKII